MYRSSIFFLQISFNSKLLLQYLHFHYYLFVQYLQQIIYIWNLISLCLSDK